MNRTLLLRCGNACFCRVGRGISPRASHRSGLDTLASSGSCHRTKAAAFRRELELLLLPVGSLPTAMTCPLRSTSITPASSLLQGSPPLSDASVLSASRLEPLVPCMGLFLSRSFGTPAHVLHQFLCSIRSRGIWTNLFGGSKKNS